MSGLDWLDEAPTGPDRPAWVDHLRACPPKFGTRRSWDRPTLGHRVAETARLLGWELMPWQRYVADVAMEYRLRTVELPDDDGVVRPIDVPVLCYRYPTGTVPRQSGKTTLGLPVKVHRALGWPSLAPAPYGGPQNIVYTAQDRNHAFKKWDKEHVPRIESAKRLRGLYKVRRTNGSEGIRWGTGSFYGIEAVGLTSGHGETLDLAFNDESFKHIDFRVDQSQRPAMITRPNAQQWTWSTQGDDGSVYFNAKCEQGREAVLAGVTEGICYFEWSAPEGAEFDDLDVWPRFHPAVGFTQTAETLRDEALSWTDANEAKRAFFNWRKAGSTFESALPAGEWFDGRIEPDEVDVPGEIALAVDIPPDRSAAFIAWAGFGPDGSVHAELDAVEILDPLEAPDRLLEIMSNPANGISVVHLNPTGGAGSLVKLLRRLGVEVHALTAREMAQACGLVTDLVKARKLTHCEAPELDDAVANVERRALGPDGSFAWAQQDRRGATVSPLYALTVAVGALVGPDADDDYHPPVAVIAE